MLRRAAETFACLLIFFPLCQCAQGDEIPRNHIQNLFDKAVVAENRDYITLRKSILAEKMAVDYLRNKASDANLVHRVLARAMLSWVESPSTNTRENHQLQKALDYALRFHGAPIVNIGRALTVSDEQRKASPVILLEIALKGPTVEGINFTNAVGKPISPAGVSVESWFRCVALGRAGQYLDSDVIPVLTSVLLDSKEYPIRTYAAIGLRMTKDARAIEPLIDSLFDENKTVRETVQRGLKEITGQDFGTDQAKYRDWWKANKVQLLKKEPTKLPSTSIANPDYS